MEGYMRIRARQATTHTETSADTVDHSSKLKNVGTFSYVK